jgi:hypothetical protein
MPDSTLSQALKEAYASAPSVIIYHTLELRHPAFSSPIRVVRDRAPLVATLEATAPVNAGQSVTFLGFAFDFTKPEISASGLPMVQIEIDNADRIIVANIEAAMASTSLVTCTYREYISTDLSGPQNNPPLNLTVLTITADVYRVKCTAGFINLNNYRFPRTEYDAETYAGLAT